MEKFIHVSGDREGQVLTIRLNGNVDSTNAGVLDSQLEQLIRQNSDAKILFDAEKLEYISSAGLRVILKIIKLSEDRITIFNVNATVADILSVTGFDSLLDVRKAMRQVSVENCPLIARGFSGFIYRLSKDEIIKVYTEETSLETIEIERERAQTALLLGVPTAISYDVVRVGNAYGLVFEMVKSDTLFSLMTKDPEKYAAEYAKLVKNFHSIEVDPGKYLSMKEVYKGFINRLSHLYTKEECIKLKDFIDSIPDRSTFIHADFHPNNVMVQNGELLIIDMADIGYGHPIFDLMKLYQLLVSLPERSPEVFERTFSVKPEISLRVWKVFMKIYFETEDEDRLLEIENELKAYSLLGRATSPAITSRLPEDRIKADIGAARKYLIPNLDAFKGILTF